MMSVPSEVQRCSLMLLGSDSSEWMFLVPDILTHVWDPSCRYLCKLNLARLIVEMQDVMNMKHLEMK